MSNPINELPNMPVKTDWTVQGPLAGIIGMNQYWDYKDNVQRQKRDSDLAYADKSLDYETKVKDVPLKDAERANKIKNEEVVKTLYDKGLISEQMESASKAAIENNITKMDNDQRTRMENRAIPWAVLAAGMPDDMKDPMASAKYEQVKQHAKTVYNIDLPQVLDAQTMTMLKQRGAMSGLALKHKWDMEKVQVQTESQERIHKASDTSRERVAQLMADARPQTEDKSVYQALINRISAGQPVGIEDLMRAAYTGELHQTKTKEEKNEVETKRKEYARTYGTNKTEFVERVVADMASVGVVIAPSTVTTPEAMAKAYVQASNREEMANDLIKRFGFNNGTTIVNGKPVLIASREGKQAILGQLRQMSGVTNSGTQMTGSAAPQPTAPPPSVTSGSTPPQGSSELAGGGTGTQRFSTPMNVTQPAAGNTPPVPKSWAVDPKTGKKYIEYSDGSRKALQE